VNGGWSHQVVNSCSPANFCGKTKTALREEVLKAMPSTFMEANKQALALERITAEQKKQFVSVQVIGA
jgi:hypothetical protein